MAEVAPAMDRAIDPAINYPHLQWLSREHGIDKDVLVHLYQLEKDFHARILATPSAADRRRQYNELYTEVYRLKRAGSQAQSTEDTPEHYARLALTFRRELSGKSVLDVGCGNGIFLDQVAKLMPHGDLCGLDTADTILPQSHAGIEFLRHDIVSFELGRSFDVIYSHQVLEHIAPADISSHLKSIHAALKPGGKFIVLLPNKLWGPQDITRIVDNTFSGRVPAQGSHLNESSYSELEPLLEAHGFGNIRTTLPFALYIPFLRSVRVRPWINRLFESHAALRNLANKIQRHHRPIFKNPIVLIGEKTTRPGDLR